MINGKEQLHHYLETIDAGAFNQEWFKTSDKNNGFWKELMSLSFEDQGVSKTRFLPTCKRKTGAWKKQKENGLLPVPKT